MALVIDPQIVEQMQWALRILKSDEPVALPTETVYGLAARVYSPLALSRVFALKGRPYFDPLIAHVSGIAMAKELVAELGPTTQKLMQRFWPGPLTLLCKKSSKVPDLCTGGSPEVALRQSAHPVFANLLTNLGEPLAAPSANRFQGISPTQYQHVLSELGSYGLAAVVDGGPAELGIESTVVRVLETDLRIEVLRPGATPLEDLQSFAASVGFTVSAARSVLDAQTMHHAPGQLAKHYSPGKAVVFLERDAWLNDAQVFLNLEPKDLVLVVNDADLELAKDRGLKAVYWVLGANLAQSAARLFAELRRFDADDKFNRLVVLAPEPLGLGVAIADRLRRAGGQEL